eukprot:152095-Rhodomonas_salina.1
MPSKAHCWYNQSVPQHNLYQQYLKRLHARGPTLRSAPDQFPFPAFSAAAQGAAPQTRELRGMLGVIEVRLNHD